MIKFQEGIVEMSRVDKVCINLTILDLNNKIYVPKENDEIVFSVWKNRPNTPNNKLIFKKTFDMLTYGDLSLLNGIIINQEDTKFLLSGRYFYDVVLNDEQTVAHGKFYLLD